LAETSGEPIPGEERPFAEFYRDVDAALAEWETGHVEAIEAAGEHPQHWTARAWLLERRFPDKYGRRDRMDHRHRHELVIGIGAGEYEGQWGMSEYVWAEGRQRYVGLRLQDGRLIPPGSEERSLPSEPEEIPWAEDNARPGPPASG
jgi:hypothetical protein